MGDRSSKAKKENNRTAAKKALILTHNSLWHISETHYHGYGRKKSYRSGKRLPHRSWKEFRKEQQKDGV
jgi:hypothetical protein